VFRRARLSEPRLTPAAKVVGENLPVVKIASWSSLEFRDGPAFGTCSVCLCFNCEVPGCCRELDGGEGAIGDGYDGGEENRWGEVGAVRVGVSTGTGVAGNNDVVYVNGPVLPGFVDMGGGMGILFGGSLSPVVGGFVSMAALGGLPFVDTMELRSLYDVLGCPFCATGLLLPLSGPPLMIPFTDNALPSRDNLCSQLLALDRPFGIELRAASCGISPFVWTLQLSPTSK
jgi:hypothetical protein